MNTLTTHNLYIAPECLGRTMIATGARPFFEYRDGVRQSTILGYTYSVVLPERGYEGLDIKVPGSKTLNIVPGSSVPVVVSGLMVRPYFDRTRNVLAFTATAKEIKAADDTKR